MTERLTYDQINWNSSRGVAYQETREKPGSWAVFQGEDGMRRVRYIEGTPADEILPGLMSKGSPGYWYEVAVRDTTKMTEDLAIGFRVYEPREGE